MIRPELSAPDRTLATSRDGHPPAFIVGLAAKRNYISVSVDATDGRAYPAERYADRLGKVKVGKSSISFASIDDVDLDRLSELISEAKRLMT